MEKQNKKQYEASSIKVVEFIVENGYAATPFKDGQPNTVNLEEVYHDEDDELDNAFFDESIF